MKTGTRTAAIAWLITSLYYFYQYTLRSAPAVMMPQLSTAFGLTVAGVASMAGLFYYGYSPFSLVAGVAMDRVGPRRVVPLGAGVVGVGALMFASGNTAAANIGRFLQGAGGVFALVGAFYIASTSFSPSRAATLVGVTQMFGMAGGSAGQFAVGPVIASGVRWNTFWMAMGIAGLGMAVVLLFLLPARDPAESQSAKADAFQAFRTVFGNPQSWLCGAVAGLLMIPTSIFGMVWGVRYLQEAHGVEYGSAVLRSAAVPFGWIIGCPLLGAISDRLGRRKPVISGGALVLLGCLAWILYGPTDVLPRPLLGLATGIASGAAMLPYVIIKEANPPAVSGTATGVVNFLNFTCTALLGPVFGARLMTASGGVSPMALEHFQAAFLPFAYGVALAIVFTFFMKETGQAARATVPKEAAVTP